jgi:hypothetical protein
MAGVIDKLNMRYFNRKPRFNLSLIYQQKVSPKYKHRRAEMGFGPTSVILCHNSVGAVAYVETKCALKVKLLSVPKKDPCQILAIGAQSPHVEFIPECFGTVTAAIRL